MPSRETDAACSANKAGKQCFPKCAEIYTLGFLRKRKGEKIEQNAKKLRLHTY